MEHSLTDDVIGIDQRAASLNPYSNGTLSDFGKGILVALVLAS